MSLIHSSVWLTCKIKLGWRPLSLSFVLTSSSYHNTLFNTIQPVMIRKMGYLHMIPIIMNVNILWSSLSTTLHFTKPLVGGSTMSKVWGLTLENTVKWMSSQLNKMYIVSFRFVGISLIDLCNQQLNTHFWVAISCSHITHDVLTVSDLCATSNIRISRFQACIVICVTAHHGLHITANMRCDWISVCACVFVCAYML